MDYRTSPTRIPKFEDEVVRVGYAPHSIDHFHEILNAGHADGCRMVPTTFKSGRAASTSEKSKRLARSGRLHPFHFSLQNALGFPFFLEAFRFFWKTRRAVAGPASRKSCKTLER